MTEDRIKLWPKVREVLARFGEPPDLITPLFSSSRLPRYASKGECSHSIETFEKILPALHELQKYLGDLPEQIAKSLSINAEFIPFLLERIEQERRASIFERDAHWGSGRGRGKNIRAHFIAEEVALHYVRCKLKKPTFGHNDGKPSTVFTRAVVEIFAIVGITAGFRDPCTAAATKITPEVIEDARRMRLHRVAVARRARGELPVAPALLSRAERTETADEN